MLEGENDAETPLQAAASSGNIVVMQMLLDANASLSRLSSSGSTALSAAVLNCQTEAVKFLLQNGVDPNSFSKISKGSRLDDDDDDDDDDDGDNVWFESGSCI